MSDAIPHHVAVLPVEAIALLAPASGETWVDATLGGGGHGRSMAQCLGPTGRLIGLDRDAAMLKRARPALAGLPVTLVQASFDQLDAVLAGLSIAAVDGL